MTIQDLSKETPSASAAALTVNLITATLGAGILSLPWATAGASLLPAVAITVGVMTLNAGTNMILVAAADRHCVFDLGNLLGRLPGAFGRSARLLCDVSVWTSVFLCLVAYLVVVADSLGAFWPSLPRDAAISVGAAVVLPLCFMDQRRLAFSSSLSVAANLYTLALLGWTFLKGEATTAGSKSEVCLVGFSSGGIAMVSNLMQAAIIQMCVLPMYEQLERRSLRRFAGCLCVSTLFVISLFVCFAAAGYLAFGTGVAPNILDDLPQGPPGDLARLGMAVAVLAVYPILIASMIAPLRHAEEKAALARIVKVSEPLLLNSAHATAAAGTAAEGPCSLRPSHLATLAVVVASALGACRVRNLAKVNVVNGAVQVAGLVGIAPGLVGLFLLDRRGLAWRAAMGVLVAGSIVVCGLGLTYQDNAAAELEEGCWWTAVA